MRFLYTPQGKSHVYRKRLIELGAGTGLVSMFCARYLGAEHTLVTDGAGEVIDCMVENMYLNQLDDRKRMSTAVLQWGHAVRPELVMDKDEISDYDLVLGADIVCL